MKDFDTIFIDFDNVVVNSIKAIVDIYNEDFQYYKNFRMINWWDINSYGFSECNCATTEYLNTYFNQKRFFDRLEFMPWAKETILMLTEIYKVKFITLGYRPNLTAKKEWLDGHFPGIKMNGINMKKNNDKSHVDMKNSLLLDDDSRYLISSNAEERICFGDIYSWNEDWDGKRLLNWMDVRKYLI